jgi:hypothetical protein
MTLYNLNDSNTTIVSLPGGFAIWHVLWYTGSSKFSGKGKIGTYCALATKAHSKNAI